MSMMSITKQTSLLLLVLLAAANATTTAKPDHHEDCHDLKLLANEDTHKVYGDWVLVWSVSDHQQGWDLLSNVSSSHVELRLLPDNHTIVFSERNMFLDKSCINYYINISITDSDNHTMHVSNAMVEKNGVLSPYNESGDLDYYETCADCLMTVYTSSEGRYLLIYKREGHHRDVEQMTAAHSDHHKMSECLKIPHDKPFIYDGTADFCHKKSSPEVEATAEPDHS